MASGNSAMTPQTRYESVVEDLQTVTALLMLREDGANHIANELERLIRLKDLASGLGLDQYGHGTRAGSKAVLLVSTL
jgi:hypothetical protein